MFAVAFGLNPSVILQYSYQREFFASGEGNRGSRLGSGRRSPRRPQKGSDTIAIAKAPAATRTTPSDGRPTARAASAPIAPTTDATITDSIPGSVCSVWNTDPTRRPVPLVLPRVRRAPGRWAV